MLLSCNVDCGEVLPGHRLVARGLRDDGYSNDSMNSDYMGHYEGKPVHRVVSLVYALIPGLAQPERGSQSLDVDAKVVLDPLPDPAVWGSVLTMGGERDARPGGSETVGAFGAFILPEGTKRLLVELSQIALVPIDAPRTAGGGTERRLGTLEIEITAGAAHWVPA